LPLRGKTPSPSSKLAIAMWVVRRRQGTPVKNADESRQGGRWHISRGQSGGSCCGCFGGLSRQRRLEQGAGESFNPQPAHVSAEGAAASQQGSRWRFGRRTGSSAASTGIVSSSATGTKKSRCPCGAGISKGLGGRQAGRGDDSFSNNIACSNQVMPSAALVTVVNDVPQVVQEARVYEAMPQPAVLPAMGEVQVVTTSPAEVLLPKGSGESKEQYVPAEVMVSPSNEEAVQLQLELPASPASAVVMQAPPQAASAIQSSSSCGNQLSARLVRPIRVSSPSGARQGLHAAVQTKSINMAMQMPQSAQRLQVRTPLGAAQISPGLMQPAVVYMGQTSKPPSPANMSSPVMMMPGTPTGRITVQQQSNSPQSRPGSVLVQDGAKPVQSFRAVQPGFPMRTAPSTMVQSSIRSPSIPSTLVC